MLLTKDNLLRYVKENKYTTPTHVAREFETTTTIASAALGELTSDKSVLSTHLKYGSTPYYYDTSQRECLAEIAQYHFSGNELELFNKLKDEQIVSINALTIPQRSIIAKLQDIYYTIEISKNDKVYTFYIWYLRDEKTTRQQIQDAFSPTKSQEKTTSRNNEKPSTHGEEGIKHEHSSEHTNLNNTQGTNDSKNCYNNSQSESHSQPNPFSNLYSNQPSHNLKYSDSSHGKDERGYDTMNTKDSKHTQSSTSQIHTTQHMESTQFRADTYLYKHAHTIIEKEKHPLGTKYKTSVDIHSFTLYFDCLSIEQKKVQPHEIISFYTSSLKPKIIFHTNLAKKNEQLIEELENCFLIRIETDK